MAAVSVRQAVPQATAASNAPASLPQASSFQPAITQAAPPAAPGNGPARRPAPAARPLARRPAPPAPPQAAAHAAPLPAPARPATPSPGDVQLTQRVLADLQRQVELMLEVRLREALAPILARASDALVRDAKKELTAAMRDIVSRSIARELGRREDR